MSVNKVVSDLRDPGPLKKDNETSLFFSLTVSSRGGRRAAAAAEVHAA